MFYRILAVSVFIMGSAGFSHGALSEAAAEENATVVIYRADDSLKTRRVGMYLHMAEDNLGRLKFDRSVVISRPSGEYTLASNISETTPLVIDLKPGKIYYVHADVALRQARVKVSFKEVEEQLAKIQQPTLEIPI